MLTSAKPLAQCRLSLAEVERKTSRSPRSFPMSSWRQEMIASGSLAISLSPFAAAAL